MDCMVVAVWDLCCSPDVIWSFVACWFLALMGNNFCLLVDILVFLEPFGVVRLENTDNSTAKFKNFTLLTGSVFFLLLALKNCLHYVNGISPREIKILIKIIVCFSLNENPIQCTLDSTSATKSLSAP